MTRQKMLTKREIFDAIDNALAETVHKYIEKWDGQQGETSGLPAHAYQNKMSGAYEMRQNLRQLIDDVLEDDPYAT